MSVELLAAVTPIYCVGESHSLNFTNLLFRPAWAEESFLSRNLYLSRLISKIHSSPTELHPDMLAALTAEGVIDTLKRPTFLNLNQHVAYLSSRPVMPPAIVFFAGDIDMHGLVWPQVENKIDFHLPNDPGYGVNPALELTPFAAIHELIADILVPFFNTLQLLRQQNFTRLMVHCLPPRTTDDAIAAPWIVGGKAVTAAVRSKLTIVMNRLIADRCRKIGVGFIDTWPETTTPDGYMDPAFDLDGVHVNRRSTLISLDKIVAHLVDYTAETWNPARYHELWRQSDAYAEANAEAAAWEADGRVGCDLGEGLAREVLADAAFSADGRNGHARTDWAGWPRAGRPRVVLGAPSGAMLDRIASLLQQAPARATLQGGADRELTVASCRIVRHDAAAEGRGELASTPIHGRRALLFLAGHDRLSFESPEGEPLLGPVQGPGHLVVYDPRRVRTRIRAGTEALAVVEMGVIPRLSGHPFRVIASGLCDWPVDPYQFTVHGMKASPALIGPEFRERAKGPA